VSNKKLIQQYVNTGVILNKHQVNKLSGNNLKSYLRRRMLESHQLLPTYLRDYEIYKLSESDRNKFVSGLDDDDIFSTLKTSSEPENMLNMLGQKGIDFISDLGYNGILYLISNNPKNIEDMIKMLGEKGKYGDVTLHLDIKRFARLLGNSNDPERLVNALGEKGKQLIRNLSSHLQEYLQNYALEPKQIKNMISKYGVETRMGR